MSPCFGTTFTGVFALVSMEQLAWLVTTGLITGIELVTCTWLTLSSWWRHQMETFSALLTLCAGNSPGPGEFPAQRPVTQSFGVFFDLRLNEWLSKPPWGWWFETLSWSSWRQCNVMTKSLGGILILSQGHILLLADLWWSLPLGIKPSTTGRFFFFKMRFYFLMLFTECKKLSMNRSNAMHIMVSVVDTDGQVLWQQGSGVSWRSIWVISLWLGEDIWCRLSDSFLADVMALCRFGTKPSPRPLLTHCHLVAWKQTSVRFSLNCTDFHSR